MFVRMFVTVTFSRHKVTRAGFKPTTTCLEGRSSIQLSYRVKFVRRQTGAGPLRSRHFVHRRENS